LQVTNRPAQYATLIVVIHLLVTLAHGLAHRELQIGLPPAGSVFVGLVIVIAPLVAAMLTWSRRQRFGLVLLSLSMFGSLLFGFYHHFVAEGADHVHSQPAGSWGTAFVFTAYGLMVTEAIGTWVGIHFLRAENRNKAIGSASPRV
jgi:hypothetical protein